VGVIEEKNWPYRRLTVEWYKDPDTGTFLAKLTVEGESVKGGRREAVFALSSDEIVNMNPITPSELGKILNSDSLESIIDYIGGFARYFIMETKSESAVDHFTDYLIEVLAEAIARGVMMFDANKLKMALSDNKS